MTITDCRTQFSSRRIPLARLAFSDRVLVAVAALILSLLVYETARLRAELVYAHGVGVKAMSGQNAPMNAAEIGLCLRPLRGEFRLHL